MSLNWDDLKYFLMVCKTGSVRTAANSLGVNHATVSRRIKHFEESLGEQLFERTSKGYVKTLVGEEIYYEAAHLQERLLTVERRVAGKDGSLSGEIRVTLPDLLAQNLLMPGFAEFCSKYPDIQLDINDSVKVLNLANREADVAFRLCNQPEDYLIGKKLATIHRACYMARKLLPNLKTDGWLESQSWLGWTTKLRKPKGKIAREYPRFDSKHKIISGTLQAQACINGMGIAILPCFWPDSHPDLVRIPPFTSEAKYDLWIVNHPDLRGNNKIQTFVRFMSKHVQKHMSLISGEDFEKPLLETSDKVTKESVDQTKN